MRTKLFLRFTCVFMVLALVFASLPLSSFAEVKELANNTPEENQAILSLLSEVTDGESNQVYELLRQLGLLDANGDLMVDQMVNLDGVDYTLDELIDLLDEPDVDLSQLAIVDGSSIALGDLKTIVEIERQLAYIQNTYFTNQYFTQEQLDTLEDMMEQIRDEGITANFDGMLLADVERGEAAGAGGATTARAEAAGAGGEATTAGAEAAGAGGATTAITEAVGGGDARAAGAGGAVTTAGAKVAGAGGAVSAVGAEAAGAGGVTAGVDISRAPVITVTPSPGNSELVYPHSGSVLSGYILRLSGELQPGEIYSFSWKYIEGFLPKEYFYDIYMNAANTSVPGSILLIPEGQDFTIGGDGADLPLDDPADLQINFVFVDNGINLNDMLEAATSGRLTSFIEFDGGNGLLFSDGITASDVYNLPITLRKPNAFTTGNWTLDATGGNAIYAPMELNSYTNPVWYLVDSPINDNAVESLGSTAREIYYGDYPIYKIQADLDIIHGYTGPGDNVYGFMIDSLPSPFNSTGGQLKILGYQWADNEKKYNGDTFDIYDDRSNPDHSADSYPFRVVSPTGEIFESIVPYINIIGKTEPYPDWETNTVTIMAADETGGGPPYSLRANWPQSPVFSTVLNIKSSNVMFFNDSFARTAEDWLYIYNDPGRLPEVASIEIPPGTYRTGQYVPITVNFNEPVQSSYLSMNINGNIIPASELYMETTGRKATALYPVKEVDAASIYISEVGGLTDLFGQTVPDNNGGAGWNFEDSITLESALMKYAVNDMSVSPGVLMPGDSDRGVYISLELNQDPAYRTKYANYDPDPADPERALAPFQAKVTHYDADSAGGAGQYIIEMAPLFLIETGPDIIKAEGSITGLLSPITDTEYTVQLYADDSAGNASGAIGAPNPKFIPIPGYLDAFTVKAAVFVDGLSLIYPNDIAGERLELSLAEEFRPLLGVEFNATPDGTPSYTSGNWTSSAPDVAAIIQYSNEPDLWIVSLAGGALGDVFFTFTADDGGLTDPNPGALKSAISRVYTVVAGDSPALTIPAGSDSIVATQGSPAQVRWSSNAKYFASDSFQYKVELFDGYKAASELEGAAPIHIVYAESSANSAIIGGEWLQTLSYGGVPSYTARVSMPHPLMPSAVLSAYCYIIVIPKPAVARIDAPNGNLYALDSDAPVINWRIENYEAGLTEGVLFVDRVYTVNGEDETESIYAGDITSSSGVYTLYPDKVDGLKDIYMISLRVKNPDDSGYNTDGFPLYIYKNGALKLQIDGEYVTHLTMDNGPKVDGSNGLLPADTADILALRQELALIEYIGINYGDYAWSQLKDGIAWETNDWDTVSVNYKQSGLYEELYKFNMNTYLPETKMALSSIKDGRAVITATHANTGMNASAIVDARTLRQKFYLFQLAPAQRTELTYTDGKGTQKTVYTNDQGVLGLYEPDGVASDVQLKAEENGAVWLGTIYNANMLSGERDATKLQLYPLNSFKLRQVARVDLYLKQADGSPYTGGVTLRGGVYKNSGYCQDAGMLANAAPGPAANPLKDGKTPQYAMLGADGKLTVYMDSTQFWSAENGEGNAGGRNLRPTDDFLYIFEITDINGYYPLLLYCNGNISVDNIMRSADNVIVMDAYAGTGSGTGTGSGSGSGSGTGIGTGSGSGSGSDSNSGAGDGSGSGSAAGAPKPFIAYQAMDYGLSGGRLADVRKHTGHIGPNSSYQDTRLITIVLDWGNHQSMTDYTLAICDEYGFIPAAQTSEMITYPFSSMPVIKNTLLLDEDSMTTSGWIPRGKDAGLKARLSRGGIMMTEQPIMPRATDLTDAEKLNESDEITALVLSLESKASDPKVGGLGGLIMQNDKIVNGLLSVLSTVIGFQTGGVKAKMVITPSEDNTEFNAFIWAGYNSLGLDELDYDKNGMVLDTALVQSSLSATASLKDAKDMAKGEYDAKQTQKDYIKAQSDGKGKGDSDITGQLEGYFNATIKYNFDTEKWEIYVTGGGFTTGVGASYTYLINTTVGPIPVTAEFTAGGAFQVDFKAALRREQLPGLEWRPEALSKKYVNDYMTSLRFSLYLSAFAGLGFDYSVIALKVGLFGQINADLTVRFLNREYLNEPPGPRRLTGVGLSLTGTVGIKFVAKFLFISYELILASVQAGYQWAFKDWTEINEYWNSFDGAGGTFSVEPLMAALSATASAVELTPVSASATLQSRDYLDRYARSWGDPASRGQLYAAEGEVFTVGATASGAVASDIAASGAQEAGVGTEEPFAGFTPLSLDIVNGLANLQTNAYPYSYPLVSEDGRLLLYASDQNSEDISLTRIYATQYNGVSYPQGAEIAAPAGFIGYGDSSLSLAGDADFAAAAWVRQGATLPAKEAGDEISPAEQALMMNGTEIVASVWDGTGWTATRLTDNALPDMAPVIATNGGALSGSGGVGGGNGVARAIAAWRSVYANDENNILEFAQQDLIMYKLYENGAWGEAKQLYNGVSGAVRGISAAMLSDGTAAVAYTLDRSGADGANAVNGVSGAGDYEIGYSIVDSSGDPAFSCLITQDKWLNANPQLAAVKFGQNDERFILGWFSSRDSLNDIRLACFDAAGMLSNTFPDSIEAAAGNADIAIGGNYRFAKMDKDNNGIGNLSIIWTETWTDDFGDPVHGVLCAVKFTQDNAGGFGGSGGNSGSGGATSGIGLSAALDVAELPARTLLDHFDAYVASPDGKTLKAVLQGTKYHDIDPDDPDTYNTVIYTDEEGNDLPVYLSKEETLLYTATEVYANKARLGAIVADYENISLNSLTPVQFNLINSGMDIMDGAVIDLGGTIYEFDNLDLYPNQERTLTCWYSTGGAILNLPYSIIAKFSSETDALTGIVYLDYPDLGFSQMNTTSEELGMRTIRLTLYNAAAAMLSGNKRRAVRLGFYKDPGYESILEVDCSAPGVIVNADKTLTIAGEEALNLIDEGALALEVVFDIGQYIDDKGFDEIPNGGIPFYANAWIEEINTDGDTVVLPEFYRGNNGAYLTFDNPLFRTGQAVSIAIEQGAAPGGGIEAIVTLHNNSLKNKTSGYLEASLLDENNDILENLRIYSDSTGGSGGSGGSGGAGSLITLAGEETRSFIFSFAQAGVRVTAAYGDLSLANDNANLASLSFEGLPVRLSDFTRGGGGDYLFTAPDTELDSTLVSFVTKDPGASVTVNGLAADGSVNVALASTRVNTIIICVTAADGLTARNYILNVTRTSVIQTVTGVKVIPATATVQKGSSFSFNATVEGSNNPPQEVTWSLSGASAATGAAAGTVISPAGMLTVAQYETAERLTITATSTFDLTKSGSAIVTINAGDLQPPGDTQPPGDVQRSGDTQPSGPVNDASGDKTISTAPTFTDNSAPAGSSSTPGDGRNTIIIGDNIVWTPGRYSPIQGPDGIWTFPGGGTVTTPGGAVITFPAGTTIDASGRTVVFPRGESGGRVSYTDGGALIVKPGMTIKIPDQNIPDDSIRIFWDNPFADIRESDWFYDDIMHIYTRALFNGLSADEFGPDRKMTRAMLVTVLGRMDGVDTSKYPNAPFNDVSADIYYAPYIEWARQMGIVMGVGDNMFDPETAVTRQDMLTILIRFTRYAGIKLPITQNLKNFIDASEIADYAKEAVDTFVTAGIVNGYPDGAFRPAETATRAEVAAMLRRLPDFIKNL